MSNILLLQSLTSCTSQEDVMLALVGKKIHLDDYDLALHTHGTFKRAFLNALPMMEIGEYEAVRDLVENQFSSWIWMGIKYD